MYVDLRHSNVAASGAASFVFTDPAFNSPYFSPVYAAQRMLGEVSLRQSCQAHAQPGDDNLTPFEGYLLGGQLNTDLNDPLLMNHAEAVIGAPVEATVTISFEDGQFVSYGLPPLPVADPLASPTPVIAVDADLQALIADVGTFAHQASAALASSNPQRRLITGTASLGDEFAASMDSFVSMAAGTTGADEPYFIRNMAVLFGRYGALPVAEVAFPARDVYVLVDAVNGNMAGPFAMGTPFDASALLAAVPEYQPGSAAKLVMAATACIVYTDKDKDLPGGPWVPGAPLPPGLTPVPGAIPGKPSKWDCKSSNVIGCHCVTTYNYTELPCTSGNKVTMPGGGCLVKATVDCQGPGTAQCASTPNTTPASPTTVPNGTGAPPGSTAPPTGGCTVRFWYWS